MTNYEFLKKKFRHRKAEIDNEIADRFNTPCRRVTDIMCATWNIKLMIESMRRDVMDFEDVLSDRERKVLYKYIEIVDYYMWSKLYDIVGEEIR